MTQIAFHRDIGFRENLEDSGRALVLQEILPPKREVQILVIADGAGGHKAGEVAGELGVRVVSSCLMGYLASATTCGDPQALGPEAISTASRQAMEHANNIVVQQAGASEQLSGMAATIVCCVIVDEMLHVAWAGDSRGYLFHNGRLTRLTHDHSEIQRLLDLGLVSPADAKCHPLAHTINRYLGQAEAFAPETCNCRISQGDIVLLCTDGLTDVLSDGQIARKIEECKAGEFSFEELPVHLVDDALMAGATDNITVLCCHYCPPSPHPNPMTETTLTGAYPVAVGRILQD